MNVIYIAGPYRSDTEIGLKSNIDRAERYAAAVWKLGAVAVCPHKNSAFMGGIVPEPVFLEGYLELLSRCDAVYVISNYGKSSGTLAEIELARKLGLPILWNIAQVELFLMSQEKQPVQEDAAASIQVEEDVTSALARLDKIVNAGEIKDAKAHFEFNIEGNIDYSG